MLFVVLCLVVLAVAALAALLVVRSRRARDSVDAEVVPTAAFESGGPVYGLIANGPDFAPQPIMSRRPASAAVAAPRITAEPVTAEPVTAEPVTAEPVAAEPELVVAAVAAYQPHRPVVTSAGGPRVRDARAGAHRRDSDAKEIARLDALHEAGALSDAEVASLKARLS